MIFAPYKVIIYGSGKENLQNHRSHSYHYSSQMNFPIEGLAEDGDAMAAWIIGLTYLHKYISNREEGEIITHSVKHCCRPGTVLIGWILIRIQED